MTSQLNQDAVWQCNTQRIAIVVKVSLYCPEFDTLYGLLVAVTKVLPLILSWLISDSCPAVAAHFTFGLFQRRKDKEEGLTVNMIKSRNFPNLILR